MRAGLMCVALAVLGGCGSPPMEVPQKPPPRLASQTADLPPGNFLSADLVIRDGDEHRSYCFSVDELLSWLWREQVRDQRWTLLDSGLWRLDGYANPGPEHTVWIFEQLADGVELVGYRDSDIAERTPEIMMSLYYPRVASMHTDVTRQRYGRCENPYE